MRGRHVLRVKVRLFATLAEQAGGRRELVLELPEGATALQAWDALQGVLGSATAAGRLPRESVRVAVNFVYSSWERPLAEGDEVAFIPPVAGGNGAAGLEVLDTPAVRVVLTEEPLDVDAVVAALTAPEVGAVAVFVGTVREWTRQARTGEPARMRRTLSILYEAYGEMARREMDAIGREVADRWPGAKSVLAHRIGRLRPGDVSLVLAVATPHRMAAFEAVRWATDELKKRVPIWKKERYEDGEEWVGLGA